MASTQHSLSATSQSASSLKAARAAAFDLDNSGAYQDWRADKLKNVPVAADDLLVPVVDCGAPSAAEREALLERCRKFNMVIYVADAMTTKQDALALAKNLGLIRFDQPLCTGDDGVTEISVAAGGRKGTYIPYTDKPLSWHTDGYYNTPSNQVRGFHLHCRRAAEDGGMSELMDPEIVYIRLRDENPDFTAALMQGDVLTIPENIENGVHIRDAQTGPVFSVIGGHLHMRYSDRKRNIVWKDGVVVTAALSALKKLFDEPGDAAIRYRLVPGQGLICNNVLHRRTGFHDDPDARRGRMLYRARFMDRITDSK